MDARRLGILCIMMAVVLSLATGCSSRTPAVRPAPPSDESKVATQDDLLPPPEFESVSASAPVQTLAGVTVGDDIDEVTDKYGPGFFTNQEGHSGGRYYTDPGRKVTLHVEIGDHSVDEVELVDGVFLPKGVRASEPPALVSKALSAVPPIDHGLRLGMSSAEVVRRVGKPANDQTTGVQRILTYQDDGADSNYQLTLTFVGDKLRVVNVYAGE